MKVLHVIPSVSERSGGPGQAIFPMCSALSAQGVDVLLASTDADLPAHNRAGGPKRGAVTRYKNLPAIFFPTQLGASFKYSRPFAIWLDEHVSDFDVVHIHAIFNHCSIAAARACGKQGIPYIVRPLGTLDPWSMKQKSFRKKVFWNAGVKTMLTRAAAMHYTTKGEQQAVEASLGLNHGVVVPLGVEKPTTPGTDAVVKLATRFPALLDHPYVLVLSRLHPKKSLEVLIEAFAALTKRAEFRNWRLVLAGEGPDDYVASLKRLVDDQNAAELVIFPGWLEGEHKEAALRNASLLALPSHQENFGLCVMESLACGVPVLISPHVNLAPEVAAAGAGWIVPVDKLAIEGALAEALSSDSKRRQRGQAGRSLAAGFEWASVAGQLVNLYERLINESGNTSS
ncbi:MAG TPA: glycosyltransferase [Pyrinomonadaceae bacterium]|jgi:glycosyltransferase involved in cell wall biosynthesis